MTKENPNFVRRTSKRYSKLGKKRTKKQVWRRPTGRDNKMREQRRGVPALVSIGYKSEKSVRGKIQGKEPMMVYTLKDLEKVSNENIVIFAKVGTKLKVELAKKAQEKKLNVLNLNLKKFLEKQKKMENKK
jgi:large subunit ribosomal protein L32e